MMFSKSAAPALRIEGRDRVSGMPDEVLGDILSFLPLKEAVATSLLSRRWRSVYSWITDIGFGAPDSSGDRQDKVLLFKEFVRGFWARLKSSNINKPFLCPVNADKSDVDECITNAVSREVKETSTPFSAF
ncbi:hypothetical protein Droror1_Dr00003411 [Drosera rotundifolia]